MKALLIALAAGASAAAAPGRDAANGLAQDITIRSKSVGPALSVPSPTPSKAVVDEVIRSLDLGQGTAPEGSIQRVRVDSDAARFFLPFPDPPFLAFSPENIQALYDSWTFEIREADGEAVERSEGVGLLREKLDWDGAGPDGRLELRPGRRYFYRFTGRRGDKQFVVENDPVLLNSFTRREYGGETRLEVAAQTIFVVGTSSFTAAGTRYLEAMAQSLREGDPRPEGTYRFELYTPQPRGLLAKARLKALAERLADVLAVPEARIRISPMPFERSEALAAFIPPSRGGKLQHD